MATSTARKLALIAVLFATATMSRAERPDPFAFLAPDIVVESAERERLDTAQTVVQVLPGRDGYLALWRSFASTQPPIGWRRGRGAWKSYKKGSTSRRSVASQRRHVSMTSGD